MAVVSGRCAPSTGWRRSWPVAARRPSAGVGRPGPHRLGWLQTSGRAARHRLDGGVAGADLRRSSSHPRAGTCPGPRAPVFTGSGLSGLHPLSRTATAGPGLPCVGSFWPNLGPFLMGPGATPHTRSGCLIGSPCSRDPGLRGLRLLARTGADPGQRRDLRGPACPKPAGWWLGRGGQATACPQARTRGSGPLVGGVRGRGTHALRP